MAKSLEKYMDKKIIKKSETFIDKVEADMSYKAELPNDSLDFEWISEFEYCFPYIDNIVRVPKLTLVTEEDTEFKTCKYMDERNLYIYRDFEDEKLKNKIYLKNY